MTAPRRIGTPRRIRVTTAADGVPATVAGARVDAVLEDWLVEDRWWTGRPRRRRYLELVVAGGRCTVVFRDLGRGEWFIQRG